jgi:hypothetical protein
VLVAAEARVRDEEGRLAGCVGVEEGVRPRDLTRGKRRLNTGEVRPLAAAGPPPAIAVAQASERPGVEANGSSLDPDRIAGKRPYKLLAAPEGVAVRRLRSRFDWCRLPRGRRCDPGCRFGRRSSVSCRRLRARWADFMLAGAAQEEGARRQAQPDDAKNVLMPEPCAHRRK